MNQGIYISVPTDSETRRHLREIERKTGIKPQFAMLAILRQAAEEVLANKKAQQTTK